MTDRPAWDREGRDWPNRARSRFVTAAGLRWHVQVAGRGPVLLLLHGTAAATHSWRDLLPLLAERFTVVAPDLPGHGFTAPPSAQGLTLNGMAAATRALLEALDLRPEVVAAHSAGAAVALRMALDGAIAPRLIVALNGALTPMGRENADFFTRTAKLLAGLPFVPRLFAWGAGNTGVANRLLRDTGSTISAEGVEFYTRLLRKPTHLAAALGMMASWDLRPLLRDLPRLRAALVLVVGTNDRAVPAAEAERVRAILPAARVHPMPGLGHLAHEERPEEVARLVADLAEAARAAA